MSAATILLILLAAGLASQWFAWQVKLPAIVVLIATGLTLGPIGGFISLEMPRHEVTELIGLGVAIILFEGGMDLKLGELKRVGHGIGRLTIIAPPIAWLLGTLTGHYVGGLSWPVSVVIGAILVVTGPTVILPLLRQARLNKESASLLKWEGIVNDPIGVLLAVLSFQYLTIGGGFVQTLAGLAAAIAVAAVLGGAGGWATGWLYRRGVVPEHLKAPILMVLVLVVYWASNLVQHEAGLLSVTLMGLVVGNMKLVEIESLQRFKENLTVVLLSVLFIVIPSQLQPEQLLLLDWRMAGFTLAILLLVRPATILLSTWGAPMRQGDRVLLAWIAPRGIVAAATAGIFGPALVDAGYPDADKLLPLTFIVIIATVLAHGLTIERLAQQLDLAAGRANGLLIVGATRWSLALATLLKQLKIDVLVVDGAYERLKAARMAGIDVWYGEILSDHAEHTLEVQHLSFLLAATENDFYNALICKSQGRAFGNHRSFQLALHGGSAKELKGMALQRRGYFAFDPDAKYEWLDERLAAGWTVQSTKFTKAHGWDEFTARRGEAGVDWLLIGGISPSGLLRLYAKDHRFKLEAGWIAIHFSPEPAAIEPTADPSPAGSTGSDDGAGDPGSTGGSSGTGSDAAGVVRIRQADPGETAGPAAPAGRAGRHDKPRRGVGLSDPSPKPALPG